MASSKPSATKKPDLPKSGAARRRPVEMQRVQNVLLVWLDNNAEDNSDDCRNTIMQLRRAVNDVNTYTDVDQCVQFIETIKDNKVCMIISGALGQHVVPRVHDMSQVDSIFVFCGNKKRHEGWAKDWPKIKGVFTEITPICEALRQAAQQCEHNATPMSFVTSGTKGDRLDPSFMYTQILKEILSTIKFGQQHIKDYADYCREAYSKNKEELKYIEQLEGHYEDNTPIWWYTCECFLYPMLNRALRIMDGDIMTRMGFFINDLHRHIEQLHKEQYAGHSSTSSFTVFRGQGLSKGDFEQLLQTKGELMSFNNFLSTSKTRPVSLGFAQRAMGNPDLVGILFVMKVDPAQSTTPFAFIGEISAIKIEDEVLFAMHSVFRVRDIKSLGGNNRLYEVHLTLTSDNDKELRALTDRIRQDSFPDSRGWHRLASVLYKMGQLEKAEEIYETLLRQATSEKEKASIYNQLGLIKERQGEYQEAITFYEKALAIQQQSLPPTHPDLASTYNNIGVVYESMGDYPKALASYDKALAIQQQSLPPTHPDLAISYNNVGSVYQSMGDYPKALASYDKALAIRQQSLPPTHPDLASTYNNIGSAYYSMGDYPKALASYDKALAIQQQSLPPTHPDLAISYNNIGSVYKSMGDYPQALASYDKALAIRQQSLPPTHPDLAMSYNNIGVVYRSMGDYPKALASHEKALAIRQQSLPPTHPDLAMSYNNIGVVYRSMGDYPKALASHEKALAIRQQSLPPTHPDLASSYNNIGVVYENMGNYPKALSYYEKDLAISQQSLPPTHPDLALSYNNIGMVYEKMGNYSKACSFSERAVQIAQHSLPANHPDLEKHRRILERIKKKL